MKARAGGVVSLLLLGVLVACAVLLCVRLGIWQLNRLEERRAYNNQVAARFDSSAERLEDVLRLDTASGRWRHVSGVVEPDYSRELVLASRMRSGSPGVWIVTPVRMNDSDTLLALVRGWIYSANGRTVDLSNWRETDTIHIDGRTDAFHRPSKGEVRLQSDRRAFRWLERDSLAAEWGQPVASMLVYQLGDTTGGRESSESNIPARFALPNMDEGPHRGYAVQWFSFATVFLVGYGAVIASSRRRTKTKNQRPTPV